MKKNISINLFGTLYQIDEDAYSLLERYIDSMKSYFSRQEGGEEIADDIEHRVAELLWQQKQGGAEAVNIDDIKNIIKTIGNPADFEEEAGAEGAEYAQEVKDENNGEENNTYGNNYKKESSQYSSSMFDQFKQRVAGRRLYRDPYNKVLGGVCSGLSTYFNYGDPVLWRLAFVLLCFLLPFIGSIFSGITGFFGLTIHIISFPSIFMIPILYLVFLIVVPEARTPEDRLRMQGKEVNPENLQEEVLNEANGNFGGTYYSSRSNGFTSASSSKSGVYGSGVKGKSDAAGAESATGEDESVNTEGNAQSGFTDDSQADKEEHARRAKASYDQYMYYKRNHSSTGANIAKGCGIGCLAIIFSPVILFVFCLLFFLVVLLFALMCIPFGLIFGDVNYNTNSVDIPLEVFAADNYLTILAGTIAALVFICIPIYALIRRRKADRKRFSSGARLSFIIVCIASLAIACLSYGSLIYKYRVENQEHWKEYYEEQQKKWIVDGIKFYNEEDYYYFRNNGWKMVEADCSERYTNWGEYMNGDRNVRYLDAYTEGNHVRYTAENTETLQPGTYRLVANCRAEHEKVYIFCYNDKFGKDKTIKYAEIPAYGNEGGNIWLTLVDSTYNTDKVVKALVDEFRNIPSTHLEDEDRTVTRGEEYANVHDGKGYGWSYVYIDDIVVNEPLTVKYGVTTLKDGKGDYHGWFSATDFRFVKVN